MHVILEVHLGFSLSVRGSLATVGKFPRGIIWANFLVFSSVCSCIPDKASLSLIIAGKRKYCFVCHCSEFVTDQCSFILVMIFFNNSIIPTWKRSHYWRTLKPFSYIRNRDWYWWILNQSMNWWLLPLQGDTKIWLPVTDHTQTEPFPIYLLL